MVVDASAILAILLKETDGFLYNRELARNCRKYICPFNALEADIVITSRLGNIGKEKLDNYLFHSEVEIIPFTRGMLELAYDAWQKFGKGRNRAKLNMGDCCAYATAKVLNEPLLFKGGDFNLTDIQAVI